VDDFFIPLFRGTPVPRDFVPVLKFTVPVSCKEDIRGTCNLYLIGK